MPRPESARAPAHRGEAEDPATPLLGRPGPPRSRQAIAAGPRRQPVAEAGHGQAQGLPGQHGRRAQVNGAAESSSSSGDNSDRHAVRCR
jgi:hypothetical protein